MHLQTFDKADGATLSYVTLGPPSAARTLVCHPGGPGVSGAYFGDMCGIGSERLRVVLFNPRGTGASTKPLDRAYELQDYAADLDALRVHLGLERVDLLGHSHGGFVGMVYAISYPDHLDRLILACSAPRFSSELRDEAKAAFAAHDHRPWYEDALDAQRRRQAWDFTTPAQAAALYAREARLWFAGDGPGTDALLRALGRERPDLEALRYFNERLAADFDLRSRLCEIRAPTLVLNGDVDFFGPQISARELIAIPGSRAVMLPDAGHWPFAETPERFRAELEEFLTLDLHPAL